jgi:PAS domain S-box-containing protein
VIFSGETENGPGGIRTVFDMTYFLSSQRNYDRVLDFEGEFHELLRSYNADALCAYFYEYIPDFFYDKLSGVHSSLRVDPSVFRSPSLLEKTDPFSTRRVEEAIGQLLYSALLPRNFRRGETGEVSEGDTPCLFALIPDICLAVDPEMNIAYATPNCSNTLGYRQEELEGRKLNCLFPRNDFLLLEEKIRAGGPASAVLFGRHKDGEPSPLLITIRDITAGAMTAGHLVVLKPLEGTPLEDMPKATDRPGDRLAEKLDSDIIGEREFAVIRGVLQGKQNKEIATELNLAEITIKKQLSEIYRKLHVRNRMELIKLIQRIE